MLDFLGIVFGHVYYYLNTIGLLRAPERLKVWYKKSPNAKSIREKYEKVSGDFVAGG
jgi:hypothetical protein